MAVMIRMVVLVFALVSCIATGGCSSGTEKEMGAERGPCYPNNTRNLGVQQMM
ncbi:MAG: hypothetical protein V1754_11620 [Pseudomonadota bacterium]